MKCSRLVFVSILLSTFIGCKSNSTSPGSNTNGVVIPKVGSSYTFENTTVDSNGVVTSTDTSVTTIVKTNVRFGGYNDVTLTSDSSYKNGVNQSVAYVRFLANGDIALLVGISNNNDTLWFTNPTGSRIPQQLNFHTADSANSYYDTEFYSSKYLGLQTLYVGGAVVNEQIVSFISSDRYTSSGYYGTDSLVQQVGYDPGTGVVGNSFDVANESDGGQVGLTRSNLIAFKVKQ